MIPVASVPIPPTRSIPERGFPFSSPFAYHSSATAGRRTTTQCVGMAQAGFPISDMFSVSRVFFSFDPKKSSILRRRCTTPAPTVSPGFLAARRKEVRMGWHGRHCSC
jgi:hypothetical protein